MGATVRMYVEQYEADPAKQGADAQEALAGIIATALDLSKLQDFIKRDKPTVITWWGRSERETPATGGSPKPYSPHHFFPFINNIFFNLAQKKKKGQRHGAAH